MRSCKQLKDKWTGETLEKILDLSMTYKQK